MKNITNKITNLITHAEHFYLFNVNKNIEADVFNKLMLDAHKIRSLSCIVEVE